MRTQHNSFLALPNSMSIKRKRLSRKPDLVFTVCQPELKKRDIFAELKLEKL